MSDNKALIEITPPAMRCGLGACPAIFIDEKGDFVIVGKAVTGLVPEERVAADESVVSIPKGLLADLLASASRR